MKLYTVSTAYLKEAIKASQNEKKITVKDNRPYILCPVTIKNVGSREFLIPLTSAKFAKDLQINEKSETKLIHPKTGQYLGLIRYFNMLIKPDDPNAIKEIYLDNLTQSHRTNLKLNIEAIENVQEQIASMAELVYRDYCFMPSHMKYITPVSRYCNNFKQLEVLAKNYKEGYETPKNDSDEVLATTSADKKELLGATCSDFQSASPAVLAKDIAKVEEVEPRCSRAVMRKRKAKAKKQAEANKS